MLKLYMIGSNRFNGLKEKIYNILRTQEGMSVLAVGFSELYKHPLQKKDYKTLHDLENKSIEEADVVILVNNDAIGSVNYIGEDTLREVLYCMDLKKTIWTSNMLFNNYLKIMSQQ